MRAERGATLMELLVTVGIIAIVGAVSVLGSQQLLNSYRVRSAARQVMGDLQFARLSAIKEGRIYRVCFIPGDTVVTAYQITNGACGTTPIRTTNVNNLGVTATENFTGTKVDFSPQGTASVGQVTVQSADGTKVVNVAMGAAGNPRIQ